MITELLDALVSWRLFVVALIVFGLAPALVLRLLCHAWPNDDPRRAELRAELRTVPRWERPFWVVEQIESALFDGLAARHARLPARDAQLAALERANFQRIALLVVVNLALVALEIVGTWLPVPGIPVVILVVVPVHVLSASAIVAEARARACVRESGQPGRDRHRTVARRLAWATSFGACLTIELVASIEASLPPAAAWIVGCAVFVPATTLVLEPIRPRADPAP